MIEWARIESILGVLDRIRPILQADGVSVELIDVQDNITRVCLTGLCARCACAPLMLQAGLEGALREEIRDFGELQLVYEPGEVEGLEHMTRTPSWRPTPR